MKLVEWRKAERLTQRALAIRLSVDKLTISAWECGAKRPGEENMRRLVELTAGAVAPNDFYDLPDLMADAREAA